MVALLGTLSYICLCIFMYFLGSSLFMLNQYVFPLVVQFSLCLCLCCFICLCLCPRLRLCLCLLLFLAFLCSVSHVNMSSLSLCLLVSFCVLFSFCIFMSLQVFFHLFMYFSGSTLFMLSFPHQYVFPFFVQFSLLARMRDKVSVEICQND